MAQLVLDVEAAEAALFVKAERLTEDYGLKERYQTPSELVDALIKSMGQVDDGDPITATKTRAEIFRAAVRSLGSGQTKWVKYLAAHESVKETLHSFDPDAVATDVTAGRDVAGELRDVLPRAAFRSPATAMVAWAKLLHEEPSFYSSVQQLGSAILTSGLREQADGLLPVVATVLSRPDRPHRLREALVRLGAPARDDWKLPGMGFPLASEFRRNLHWRGFKPDTHVKRLLGLWLQDQMPSFALRAAELATLVGVGDAEARKNIQYSLAGLSITPPGESPSKIDNLVWLIGANIETKNRTSGRSYLKHA
ncbi:hypothetical protein GCM10011575_30520 [Microlunatus endophyticus]|uniref:Uncharacterized protein n=1 Tax=Microlunatus endophyticus TaxID=1716077 RepID=A0A917W5A0_9ACTN|nr:hypothetical protein [Microlunatus endophyticus]GGL69861.1 hypothetical protein GCM10011575_30520 [Microlunatus endophyticus]